MRSAILVFAALVTVAFGAAAETLKLSNGDSLNGTVVDRSDERVVIEHPVLGRLVIAADQLATPKEQRPGLFGTRFLRGWERRLGAGIAGSQGDSETITLNASLKMSQSDEKGRWDFDAAYFAEADEGDRTDNHGFVELVRDWNLSKSRWFLFGGGRYDADQFEAWRHRIASSAGIGYQLVDTERWDLRTRLGVGVNRTFGDEDAWSPEGILGFTLSWQISDGQKFVTTNRVFPDLENLGEVRTISAADWIVSFSEARGLGFKIGVLNQYQSETEGKNNDFTYYGSLIYDF